MNNNIDQKHLKDFYNKLDNIWSENDFWHQYSQKIISSYLQTKAHIFENKYILNAGSAGNSYNIICKRMCHVDIADKKIAGMKDFVVASVENLPFDNNRFDNIICVGSVLNYCDAMAAISELSRVLKLNGSLIIEFESSWGFEYLWRKEYKKNASIITTEYIEKQHTQWLYSHKYIYQILKTNGLEIIDKQAFHIIDGLLSKVLSDRQSVRLTGIDKYLKKVSVFKEHGNNVILHAIKQT